MREGGGDRKWDHTQFCCTLLVYPFTQSLPWTHFANYAQQKTPYSLTKWTLIHSTNHAVRQSHVNIEEYSIAYFEQIVYEPKVQQYSASVMHIHITLRLSYRSNSEPVG